MGGNSKQVYEPRTLLWPVHSRAGPETVKQEEANALRHPPCTEMISISSISTSRLSNSNHPQSSYSVENFLSAN